MGENSKEGKDGKPGLGSDKQGEKKKKEDK